MTYGFTLVELLMVMAIIAILASMLMPMLGVAMRQARIANTKSLLMKVDQSIRLFRTDMRVYPWQSDLGAAPAEPTTWGNELGYRLAWEPTPSDRLLYLEGFHSDMAAMRSRFEFVDGKNVPPTGTASEGSHAFRNEPPSATFHTNLLLAKGSVNQSLATLNGGNGSRYIPGTSETGRYLIDGAQNAQVLTRMAAEITALKYLAGQLPVEAPRGIDPAVAADLALYPDEDPRHASVSPVAYSPRRPFSYVPYNRAGDSRGPTLSTAAARARGWRGDYLAGALRDAKPAVGSLDATGMAILDLWGHPLVYVSTVTPGAKGYMPPMYSGKETSNPSDTLESRYGMAPQGRSVTASLASDIRTTAGSAYTLEFELWSAGPDGRFAGRRDAPENKDNIAITPYLRGLR